MSHISHFVRARKSSGSQQSTKLIVCTTLLNNSSPDFCADVVVRGNDRPEILLHYLEIVPATNTLLPRWAQRFQRFPRSRYFVFVALILNPIIAASRLSRVYASHTFAVVLPLMSMSSAKPKNWRDRLRIVPRMSLSRLALRMKPFRALLKSRQEVSDIKFDTFTWNGEIT